MIVLKPKESLLQRTVKSIKGLFFHNTKQKGLALVVAGIMWVFILGQKENSVEKDVLLEYQLRSGVEMLESVQKVKVYFTGPSSALRKLNESPLNLKIDITQYPVGGLFTVEVPKDGLNLPLGVKVESLKPSRVPVVLRKASQKD
ncbi:MAG: CdaR family protein [Bdellovibrionaceae bacterium]|nr:CdaR family protein [Pseudobdellovibrionaceae bacterium]